LELRIDDKRVSLGIDQDSTVFNGEYIRRKILLIPFSPKSFVSQKDKRIEVRTDWIESFSL
jgi:hypothetical protein